MTAAGRTDPALCLPINDVDTDNGERDYRIAVW
jgi:hypothetical protein